MTSTLPPARSDRRRRTRSLVQEQEREHLPEWTAVQERALLSLSFAIGDAKSRGRVVPCDLDPASWDQVARPDDCTGCPVLSQCRTYLHTGAVTYPTVLAGRRVMNGGGVSGSVRGRRGMAAS